MNIALTTYQTAFFCPGGGEYQLLQTFRHLSRIRDDVALLDMYNPGISNIKALHVFTVCSGVEHFVDVSIRYRLPLIVSPIHWPVPDEINELERTRIRSILRQASYILVNSNSEAHLLHNFYSLDDPTKFVPIVNGINYDSFDFSANMYDQCSNNHSSLYSKPTILTLANIDRRKNLPRLAQACADLGLNLIVAGNIRDVREFNEAKRILPDIMYHGPFSYSDQKFLDVIENVDAFALPSFYETPGLTAIEAALIGLPILITKVGSTYEYFGDDVAYCDPFSVSSISQGLSQALKNRLGSLKLREKILSNYTWSEAASQTSQVYDMLN